MDIEACLDTPITLKPMKRKLVPTGLFLEIPSGYEELSDTDRGSGGFGHTGTGKIK